MKALAAGALVSLVAATSAHAQSPGSEPALVLVLGPPVLISLALDVVLLSTLVPEGTAGRGRSISAIIFSVIGATFASICLGTGLSSSTSSIVWTALSAAALSVEVGSLALGIYGVVNPTPEPEPPPPTRHLRPNPSRDPIPQLFLLPLSPAPITSSPGLTAYCAPCDGSPRLSPSCPQRAECGQPR